jgi:hypothetical protein
MNQKYAIHFIGAIFFLIIPFTTFTRLNDIGLTDQSNITIKDDNLEVIIDVEGRDISETLKQDNALLIDPNEGIDIRLRCLAAGNHSIEFEKLKTVVTFADFDVISRSTEFNVTIFDEGVYTIIHTWKFKNYLGIKDLGLISGVYEVRYDFYYTYGGLSEVLRGSPFYVRFSVNPVTSVSGVITTLAVAQAGFSIFGLIKSIQNSIPQEVGRSIESTRVSPSKKLMGYYRGFTYKQFQNEVSKAVFGYAVKSWRGDKCPQCETDWPEGNTSCPGCQITMEEAQELYSRSLIDTSLNVSKEVVDSVSGLSLSSIAASLSEGVTPTASIVSVLTSSGLTLVQPRVAKSWSDKTRKLVFKGLQTSLYSLFWIMACGISTVSLAMLVIAIVSGILLPILISMILGGKIRKQASNFWKSKNLP